MAADEIDPTLLARFGRLELLARLVVEGVMTGLHQSPFKGSSVEFAEHRAYGPGDEIKHIDWRSFGKTDRFHVKEYEEETNLKAYLVCDTSGSMGYAGKSISKLEQARRVAAALAYLMICQRDAVGLVTFDSDPRGLVPPRSAPGHFAVLCRALEAAGTQGETPLSAILNALAGRVRRRGLIVILSDGFDRIADLNAALRHLRHRHHEVLFLHMLAPEEETFPFTRAAEFRGLEGSARTLRVDPATLRALYLERFQAHSAALKAECRALRADYQKVSTDDDVARVLLEYLAARSRRGA